MIHGVIGRHMDVALEASRDYVEHSPLDEGGNVCEFSCGRELYLLKVYLKNISTWHKVEAGKA